MMICRSMDKSRGGARGIRHSCRSGVCFYCGFPVTPLRCGTGYQPNPLRGEGCRPKFGGLINANGFADCSGGNEFETMGPRLAQVYYFGLSGLERRGPIFPGALPRAIAFCPVGAWRFAFHGHGTRTGCQLNPLRGRGRFRDCFIDPLND
jgi:hypothetical protein